MEISPRAVAFQTQLYFLFQRSRQLQDLRQSDLFERVRVADYMLEKDRLFARLPSGQAQAIELVKIEGLSIEEASQRSGQSESLVKVNIHRGLKKLAALIEKA